MQLTEAKLAARKRAIDAHISFRRRQGLAAKDVPERAYKPQPTPSTSAAWPPLCNDIARYAVPEDKGVGDVVERLIKSKSKLRLVGKILSDEFGTAQPYFNAAKHFFHLPCDCEANRDDLNRRYPLNLKAERIVIDSSLPGWHVHCPGDETILTGVVRNLHDTYPGRFRTYYKTRVPEIWYNNPHQTDPKFMEGARQIGFGFNIGGTNDAAEKTGLGRPMHFMDVWARGLSEALGLPIPITTLKPDLYLTQEEIKTPISDVLGFDGPFWLMSASGKTDCKTKMPPPSTWQGIVDALPEIKFVRPSHTATINPSEPWWDTDIGGKHIVWPLTGIIDLQGRTGIRNLMRLVYHAEGIVCPITFVQHLSAGLPVRPGKKRSCIVLAGVREPPMLTHYPGDEQRIHKTIYIPMECNAGGGCWKSHTAGVGAKSDQCLRPVKIGQTSFAECATKISVEGVVEKIKAAATCHGQISTTAQIVSSVL